MGRRGKRREYEKYNNNYYDDDSNATLEQKNDESQSYSIDAYITSEIFNIINYYSKLDSKFNYIGTKDIYLIPDYSDSNDKNITKKFKVDSSLDEFVYDLILFKNNITNIIKRKFDKEHLNSNILQNIEQRYKNILDSEIRYNIYNSMSNYFV